MEENKVHALLSSSSAERWLNCPPSVRLGEGIETPTSVFAEEGTNAHALCEYKLNRALGKIIPYPELTMFDKEMDECSDSYVSFVLEKMNEMKEESKDEVEFFIEHHVNFDTWVKEGFGTADCILVNSKRLHIIDFKYGRGVSVDSTNNSQLKLYALGAISELSMFYDFDKVSLSIYQPRLNNVSTWETTKDELLKWANDVVKPAAELAYEGKGIFRCGAWCKFCPCKAICKERSKLALDIIQKDFRSPSLLSDLEIEDVLLKADEISSYLNDIKDYALAKALEGKKWINFKLVEGRSNRKFTDEGKVITILKNNNINPYDTKLRSISDIEKEVGKARFKELLDEFVNKPSGKPTLVNRSDKREELNLVKNDFTELNGGN